MLVDVAPSGGLRGAAMMHHASPKRPTRSLGTADVLEYKPHIDGLRAIAVWSVVIYHLGFGFLPGGFTGVDIFFVISGYLISRNIFHDSLAGAFSLVGFYERRARRILPAFFVVSLAIGISVCLIAFPTDLYSFAKSLLAAIFFAPNIHSYLTSDYFAPAAETLPLLHYWSLGVEEQFYIAFPLIAIAAVRFARRWLALIMVVLAAASLAASEIVLRFDPQAAFYLLPFRAFELLVGSLVALPGTVYPRGRSFALAATTAGLLLIAAAVTILTSNTPFPGLTALLPCVGAALVIWGSQGTTNQAASVLSLPPMVFFGRISYSLYLVHWPLIVFAKQMFPYADQNLRALGVLALSIVLAALSFRFVEQPVRQRRSYWTRRAVFGLAGSGVVVTTIACLIVIDAKGFPARFDADIQSLLGYLKYDYKPQFRSRQCFLDPEQKPEDIDLNLCLPQPYGRAVILWGDSHVAHLYSGLDTVLKSEGYSIGQMTASACAPILGRDAPDRPNCRPFNDFVLATILRIKPELVILGASVYPRPAILTGLDATIRVLDASGIKVVLLGPMPQYRTPVPNILAARWAEGNHDPFSDNADREQQAYLDSIEAAMGHHFSGRSDVRYVSVLGTVCADRKCPLLAPANVPIHFDLAHLTTAGSYLFAQRLAPAIFSGGPSTVRSVTQKTRRSQKASAL
jgi:peptidoglycan/LPS O-acetylase OafA/YrhL